MRRKARVARHEREENVQRQVESEKYLTDAGRLEVEAALARLGAVQPAKARNGPAPAHAESANAMLASLGGIKPAMSSRDEPATGSKTVAIAAKLVLPALAPAQRRRRFAFKVAVVLSLLLHAGSLLAFLSWHSAATGAIEQPSEAISVEIVESRTLEALQPKQIPEPAPSMEATAPVEGKTEASDAAREKAEPKPEPEIIVPQPPIVVPDAAEEVEPTARQEMPGKVETPPVPVEGPAQVVPEPPKAELADENVEAKRKEQNKVEKKKAAERAPKGGVTTKASAGKGTGGERASASSGSILAYAAHVRARVAGNKPSGGGLAGTAVVSFGVTTSGGLAYASVARTSGNSTLDQMAVSAVRGAAPFPTPPAGATSAQLRFTIPFHFQ